MSRGIAPMRIGERFVETPIALVAQARRLRGWALAGHKASTDGRVIHVEFKFDHRGGLTPPSVAQFKDTSRLRVLGARSSVMHGKATVWVTCTEEAEG